MTTIILTSTINVLSNATFVFQRDPESRIQTYLSSILKWLNNTQLNIVLVENSGYNFHELDEEKVKFKDRFEVIVFDEHKLDDAQFIRHNGSKGRHELFAINYAYNNSKLLNQSNFIIKITARFYIPEFEEYLNTYDLNSYDCLVQNNRDRCEVVGSHYTYFSRIFDMIHVNHDHIESVWKARTSDCKNLLICKVFEIESTQRGGDSGKFTDI
jgi:hypothetical protein